MLLFATAISQAVTVLCTTAILTGWTRTWSWWTWSWRAGIAATALIIVPLIIAAAFVIAAVMVTIIAAITIMTATFLFTATSWAERILTAATSAVIAATSLIY